MWTKIKWTFYILIALVVIAFFHYSLPSRDVVQINGTEVTRIDVGDSWLWAEKDAGTQGGTTTRDVRFINAQYEDGSPRVYRNEDTGWSWPPYLKFDSGNLQAQAQGFARSGETKWVAVSHYGWRIPIVSLYPNAYKMKEVEGPNVTLIPWFNIIFLIVVFLIAFAIWRRVDRWKDKNVDPVLEDAGELYDEVSDVLGDSAEAARTRANEARSGFSKWLDTWKPKKR